MSKGRELDTRKTVRVVTSNDFILAKELSGMSLKARKLLYLAISQCRKNDEKFYEYKITVPEFASMMGIAKTNIYQESYKITKELAGAIISVIPKGGKKFQHYPLTSLCDYDENSCLKIELNPKMTDLLLKLKGSFTQPLLEDFIKMRSPYSMAIWHLMQREMHSAKPGISDVIQFELTLSELRQVTGTQDKLKQVGQFKERVLDKALREIKDNCGVVITYENIKQGRTVTGFQFVAVSQTHIDESKIPQSVKDRARMFEIKQQSKGREMTEKEKAEYDRLTANAEQLSLDDYF